MNKMTLDLQLFATVQTTLLTTSGNSLSAEMKTFYDMVLIDEVGPNLVHDQFGQTRDIPKNGGKTIEFRSFTPLAKVTGALTEGVTPAGNKLDVTAKTSTVKQYGDFIVTSDVLNLTSIDKTLVETVKLIGSQSKRSLDTVTRNVLNAGTNVSYCPKIASGGAKTEVTSRSGMDTTCRLTVDMVQRTVAKLRAQNAPTIDGYYVAIIHPYVAYDLMRDPEWTDAYKYAQPENLFKGEIGKIAGVRFVQSSEAKIWRDSTCPAQSGATPAYYGVFSTLFLGQNAYGVTKVEGGGLQTIIKAQGSGGTEDPLDQRSSVGWKALKTAEILVENYMVRVESMSPVYSATVAAN